MSKLLKKVQIGIKNKKKPEIFFFFYYLSKYLLTHRESFPTGSASPTATAPSETKIAVRFSNFYSY